MTEIVFREGGATKRVVTGMTPLQEAFEDRIEDPDEYAYIETWNHAKREWQFETELGPLEESPAPADGGGEPQ